MASTFPATAGGPGHRQGNGGGACRRAGSVIRRRRQRPFTVRERATAADAGPPGDDAQPGGGLPVHCRSGPGPARRGDRRRPVGRFLRLRPLRALRPGVVSNPNMVVFGQIGRGKSAFVKTFLWRQAVFGRRAWVVDPKGEYGDLADAWGVRPVALRPGGAVRLNPLDPGPERRGRRGRRGPGRHGAPSDGAVVVPGQRLSRSRPGAPRARRAWGWRWSTASARPDGADGARGGRGAARPERRRGAARCAPSGATCSRTGATWPSSCDAWCTATCAACSTGRRRPGLDLSAPLVVLDLSALYTSAALGRTDGVRHRLAAGGPGPHRRGGGSTQAGGQVFLVVDEAWAILSNLGVARWLQSSWKLSRAFGVSNVAVLHRVSDLRSVGASDSEQVALAQGLLADSETRVVYAQSPGELAAAAELLVAVVHRGRTAARSCGAAWRCGRWASVPSWSSTGSAAMERRMVDTDGGHGGRRAAMSGLAVVVLPAGAGRRAGGRRCRPERSRPLSRPGGSGGASRGARWARRRDLRPLLVPGQAAPPGPPASSGSAVRRWRAGRVVAEPAQSLVVVGPTQSGKTTRPGRSGHPGVGGPGGGRQREERPAAPHAGRAPAAGPGLVHRPHRLPPALPASRGRRCRAAPTGAEARRMAADLAEAAKADGTTADGEFWYATAAKLLAPLLLRGGPRTAGSMADVVRWVDTQEVGEVADILERAGVPEAPGRGPGHLVPRRAHAQLGVHHGGDRAGALRPRAGRGRPSAPPFEPRAPAGRLEHALPLRAGPRPAPAARLLHRADPAGAFVAFDRATRPGRPLDPPLLVVLDEAAHIAPLPELDGLAATCASHGIQLVTVWQDLAQVRARYGARAPTVLNNHRAKLFLPGIADPDTLEYASRLIGDEEVSCPRSPGTQGAPARPRRPGAAPAAAARGAALPAPGRGRAGLRHPAAGPSAAAAVVGHVRGASVGG